MYRCSYYQETKVKIEKPDEGEYCIGTVGKPLK